MRPAGFTWSGEPAAAAFHRSGRSAWKLGKGHSRLNSVSVRVALAVSVVLALGASCEGGEPTPTTLPTAPPSTSASPTTSPTPPTPTPSPTVPAPTLPAAARADSPAGAEAFARFYTQVLDYSSRTGQVQLLESLGNCRTCRARSQGIENFFVEGGRVEGGGLTVVRSEVIRFVKNAALVNIEYNQAAGKTIAGNGAVTSLSAMEAEIFTFTLSRMSGSWTVQKLQVVE